MSFGRALKQRRRAFGAKEIPAERARRQRGRAAIYEMALRLEDLGAIAGPVPAELELEAPF